MCILGREQNAVLGRGLYHSVQFYPHVLSVERKVAIKSEEHALYWEGSFRHASPGEVGE